MGWKVNVIVCGRLAEGGAPASYLDTSRNHASRTASFQSGQGRGCRFGKHQSAIGNDYSVERFVIGLVGNGWKWLEMIGNSELCRRGTSTTRKRKPELTEMPLTSRARNRYPIAIQPYLTASKSFLENVPSRLSPAPRQLAGYRWAPRSQARDKPARGQQDGR